MTRALVACRWCGELHDCFLKDCDCGIYSYAQKAEYERWKREGGEKPVFAKKVALGSGLKFLPSPDQKLLTSRGTDD